MNISIQVSIDEETSVKLNKAIFKNDHKFEKTIRIFFISFSLLMICFLILAYSGSILDFKTIYLPFVIFISVFLLFSLSPYLRVKSYKKRYKFCYTCNLQQEILFEDEKISIKTNLSKSTISWCIFSHH